MEEKFLKEQIEKENIKVPETLLPENIGSLLESRTASEKPEGGKRAKRTRPATGKIMRWAAAAAGVLVLFGAAAAGIITANSGREKEAAAKQEYEDIYKRFTKSGSVWNALTHKGDFLYMDTNWNDGMAIPEEVENWDMIQNFAPNSVGGAASADIQTTPTDTELTYSKTNIQEFGVDEGDLFKTDGEYIYILKRPNNMTNKQAGILIVRVEGEQLSAAADIEAPVLKAGETGIYYEEMYVDNDRLIVTGVSWEDEISFAAVYDIGDRENPALLDTLTQSGSYVSSRKNGDILYLISDYSSLYLRETKEWEYYSYIPCCNEELVPADNIYCPDDVRYRGYTVVGSIDVKNPRYLDTEAVTMNSQNMYMSQNAIYFLSWVSEMGGKKVIDGEKYKYDMSVLTKFSYKDGQIEYAGETLVPGCADDQFSFNEYGGYLRLVTTSSRYKKWSADETWRGYPYSSMAYGYDTTVAGLYIFDSDLTLVGSVEDLAPGERVKSSRFIGDMAYIVTFRQTDPLFAIDTSDPANPTVMSELKISGFSEYMHPYGEGKMLGIGYEADVNTGWTECIKISMFDVSDSGNVTEEARLLLTDAEYAGVLKDHKALLIDTERNLFGFVVTCSDYNAMGYRQSRRAEYRVFSYEEGAGFKELLNCSFDISDSFYVFSGYPGALYIGDYLYIIDGDYNIKIYGMTDYNYIGTWTENTQNVQ